MLTKKSDVTNFDCLKIAIFADGADIDSIINAYEKGIVKGFTTNPTLMAKAGITNYMAFAVEVLKTIKDLPVCFEVFSDDFDGMYAQALKISKLATNVYVKIPIMNTRRESSIPLIKQLAAERLQLNITAIMTNEQVERVAAVLHPDVPAFISVFAGRIADTGRDPIPIMEEALECLKIKPLAKLLWASPREFLNIVQADQIGCHVITVSSDILAKVSLMGKDLEDFSLETVKMFYKDAVNSGFKI